MLPMPFSPWLIPGALPHRAGGRVLVGAVRGFLRLTSLAGEGSVLRQAFGACLCSQSRELLGDLLARAEVHLVGRLALECRVQSVSCELGLRSR